MPPDVFRNEMLFHLFQEQSVGVLPSQMPADDEGSTSDGLLEVENDEVALDAEAQALLEGESHDTVGNLRLTLKPKKGKSVEVRCSEVSGVCGVRLSELCFLMTSADGGMGYRTFPYRHWSSGI